MLRLTADGQVADDLAIRLARAEPHAFIAAMHEHRTPSPRSGRQDRPRQAAPSLWFRLEQSIQEPTDKGGGWGRALLGEPPDRSKSARRENGPSHRLQSVEGFQD